MADIITKLLLNDKDYSSKLDKAKRSTKDYKSEIDKLGKSIGGDSSGITKAFGTLATAVGVAGGAIGTFNKVIKSSNDLTDKWDIAVRAAKNSVDTFFTALATGDFSTFLGGLTSIIERAKEAAIALDALGNAQMSYGYFTTANQAKFTESLTVMRDQNASYSERMDAKITAEAVLGDQAELVAALKDKLVTAIQSVMSESNYLTAEQITTTDLANVLRLDISKLGEDEKRRLAEEYQEYLKEVKAVPKPEWRQQFVGANQSTGQPIYALVGPSREESDKYQAALTAVADKYKDAVLYNTILVNKSDEWLQNLIQMANQIDNADRLMAEWIRTFNRASKIEAPEVVTTEHHNIIDNIIDINSIQPSGLNIMDVKPNIPKRLPETIQDTNLPETIQDINDVMSETGNIANDTTSALETMFAAMSSLGGAIDNTAGSWLQWGANVLRAIAQAVPALVALTATESAAATASSAQAVAGGAGAVANIPYVGPALAIAAAASIAAAIAAAPKFATGGVVPGTSLYGDSVLARVNSQEMVLTREQQTILSDRLNGDNLGGRVEFVIRDSQLVGVLESYNRKISRTV